MTRHGSPAEFFDAAAFLADDWQLALVTADMDAYLDAHPCRCGPDEDCGPGCPAYTSDEEGT